MLVSAGNLCFSRRRKSVLFSSRSDVLHLSSSFLRVFIFQKGIFNGHCSQGSCCR
ncbi:hypothetical protein LINGRAHAP2_LOCUS6871 [Linum grandiflorum]